MKLCDQSAIDAVLEQIRVRREQLEIKEQRIKAWWEREELQWMIDVCRDTGVPLPRTRKYQQRYLQAGVAEIMRTGNTPPGFFAEYKKKIRSEAAQKRTPARQAQAMANLPKMQAVLKAKGYPMTPKKKAACCANLAQWRQAQGEEKARLDAGLKQALPAPSAQVKGAHGQVVEKVRGTIQHGWESIRRGARQEGRRVMALLLQAAARVAPPSLQEMLELANCLLAALAGGRLLKREEQLNGRLCRLLEALTEKRYGKYMRLQKPPEKEKRGRSEEGEAQPPGGPGEENEGAPSPPQADAAPPPEEGPDLPDKFEDLQALLDRAFFAPEPAPPPEHEFRPLVDLIGRTLWERLHLFEEFVKDKKQRLGRELEVLGKTRNGANLAQRGTQIMQVLAAEGARKYLASFTYDTQQRLATLMTLRYGADPTIDAFSARPYGCVV